MLEKHYDFMSCLFPLYCAICHSLTRSHIALCYACIAHLPILEQGCLRCATPLPTSSETDRFLCGQCLSKPPYFRQVIVPFEYACAIKTMMLSFKFKGKLAYARIFGYLLGRFLVSHYEQASAWPEAVLPVPLHPNRLKSRGFQQSVLLARYVLRYIRQAGGPRIPILFGRVKRRYDTQFQSRLSKSKRQNNLKGAFVLSKTGAWREYSHIAILDDVLTTGHTVNTLSRLLVRQAKVPSVEVWCLARA